MNKEKLLITRELEDLNLRSSKIIAFLEIKTELSTNFAMIAKGSSIRILDSDLKLKDTSVFDDCKINAVVNTIHDGQYLFGLNSSYDLIAIDLSLLGKGIAPLKITKFTDESEKVVSIDQKNLYIVHASGLVQKIDRDRFRSTF